MPRTDIAAYFSSSSSVSTGTSSRSSKLRFIFSASPAIKFATTECSPVLKLGFSVMMYSKQPAASTGEFIRRNTIPMLCISFNLCAYGNVGLEKRHSKCLYSQTCHGMDLPVSSALNCLPEISVSLIQLIHSHSIHFNCLCRIILLDVDVSHINFDFRPMGQELILGYSVVGTHGLSVHLTCLVLASKVEKHLCITSLTSYKIVHKGVCRKFHYLTENVMSQSCPSFNPACSFSLMRDFSLFEASLASSSAFLCSFLQPASTDCSIKSLIFSSSCFIFSSGLQKEQYDLKF